MKKISCFFVVLLFLLAASMFGIDESRTVTRAEFEEIAIQKGGVNVNNFSINEDTSWLARDLRVIRVSCSARNRNAASKNFAIMLAGFDGSGNVLWTMAIEPLMGMISENKTADVSGDVFCTAGTLRQTQKIWYRIIGDF
jgi:hypothetical protein